MISAKKYRVYRKTEDAKSQYIMNNAINEIKNTLEATNSRIARRDKKAFLSDQGKEIEENNRMGKTRDLFKKIRNTKGIFHEKMGTIKDRNDMDLIEVDNINKRWQE